MNATLRVVEAGTLTTVQDRGRRGHAHLGVPCAGALDPLAVALANRLVGNDESAAVLEVTFGGLVMRATAGRWFAVTGAPGPVLGSRSTDTLAWVGPPRLSDGSELPVGEPVGEPAGHDTPRPPGRGPLRIQPGPRDDWFTPDAIDRLCQASYVVGGESNRIGLRLEGPPLERVKSGELASEGMVLGAVQVPPNGLPVVLLADHPPTGGYPVIGVVRESDLWQCAQLRPGDEVRFTRG